MEVNVSQNTCEADGCSNPLTGRRRRYCSSQCGKRSYNRKARAEGKAAWVSKDYRPALVPLACGQCGRRFMGRPEAKAGREGWRRYCSDECLAEARRSVVWENYTPLPSAKRTHCEHGVKVGSTCPICHFVKKAERGQASRFKRVLRRDPCAYCGEDGQAIDHIVPRAEGGVDDETNWTSACHNCNSLKGSMPLLLALGWIPVAAEYHRQRRILYA